jgi:hypothetical protein
MPLSTDLEAYYECNDASDWTGTHPATLSSVSIGSGTGKFGDSWDFASIAAYVSLATPTPNATNTTAMAWAYNLRAGNNYRSLFFNGSAGASSQVVSFVTEPLTELAGVWSNATFTSTGTALASGGYTGWHHYAVVRNGATVTLYVDGVSIGAITPTWLATAAIKEIGGRSAVGNQGFSERLDDVAIWSRALSTAEVNQIYSSGAPLSDLLADETQQIATEIGTIVHSAAPYSILDTLESTVVHESVKYATADTLIATTVHAGVVVSGTVANITGTVSSSATWDATTLGLSTGSASFQWEWQSVPAGSTLTSGSFQLPNSGSTTLLNMSGNTGLWHLEATSSTSTQQGSIGLVDTWGDGWHGNNFVNVSVNGAPVLSNITLAAGAGPEWFNFTAVDGDTVEVTYTAGSFPNECKYYISSGSDGSVAGGFTSSAPPATPYSFTALGFSTASVITTLDSSGEGNTATVYGTTQTTNTRVGDYAFNFNGSSDYIELVKPSVLGIDGSKSRTIAFWASASAWADSTIMFSMGTNSTDQDFTFIQKATNNLALTFWAGGSDLLVTPGSTTGWNHYCVIYDSENTTSYVYQNNILLGSTVRAQNTSDSNNIKIGEGTAGWAAAPHFSGSINEFAIWDRVLDGVDRENIFFLQSGSCASGSFSGSVGLGDEFTFMPEVSGTYEVKLNVTDGIYNDSGSIFAYITSEPTPPPSGSGPIISASVPSGSLIQEIPIGYTYNTYTMMSAQRTRTVEQVPFKLGGKGIQSLRLRPNTDFTGSS